MRVEGLTGGVGVSVIWRGGNRGGLQQGATGQCKYAIAAAAAVGFGPKRWWPSGCTVEMEMC